VSPWLSITFLAAPCGTCQGDRFGMWGVAFWPATITRSVVAVFLEKTAIAYRQNLAFFLQFGWYAIAVFSKNATTLRVLRVPPTFCTFFMRQSTSIKIGKSRTMYFRPSAIFQSCFKAHYGRTYKITVTRKALFSVWFGLCLLTERPVLTGCRMQRVSLHSIPYLCK